MPHSATHLIPPPIFSFFLPNPIEALGEKDKSLDLTSEDKA